MQSAQFQLHAEIEQRHWWFTARRQIMRHLVAEVLPASRAHTVLDVGCGTGANIAALAEDYRCLGIDTSAEAIALARRAHPQVEFFEGYAPDALGPRMREVNLVLLMDVLEHVPDDLELFSRLLAETEPGTHLLLTVPASYALWSQHDESFGHYRRYDLARFREIWRGLPVTPLLSTYYNTRLYPVVRLIRGLNQLRGKSGGAAGTDFNIPAAPVNRCCQRLFAGESKSLGRMLHGRAQPFERGVSLIAVLRREAGQVQVRSKPAHFAADHFDPTTGQYLPRG